MTTETRKPTADTNDLERFGSNPLALLRANIEAVHERVARASSRAGRAADEVRLLAVSKTVPASILRLAYEAGIRSFGENKIQEALHKHDQLQDLPVSWSIVGHLQTNKVKYLARFASEFQALDSLRLAEHLDARLEREGRALDVFIQVNTSGEPSKFGLQPHELKDFVSGMDRFPRLRPRGLMTLALFSEDMTKVRPCFRLLRELRDDIATSHPAISGLSMGMSGDFEEAIEEGADVVRVGQAIFGRRPTSNAHYWPGFAPT